jgi:hypothetical protein
MLTFLSAAPAPHMCRSTPVHVHLYVHCMCTFQIPCPACTCTSCRYRDPSLPVHRTEITRFPHAVLEVKLSLPEGQSAPPWVQDMLDSGYLTEVGGAGVEGGKQRGSVVGFREVWFSICPGRQAACCQPYDL